MMLDLSAVDLNALGEALDDHSDHVRWYIDRVSDDVLWEATMESGITVSAVVVDEDDWAHPRRPFLRSATSQGRSVA